jgi:hypothetical protein
MKNVQKNSHDKKFTALVVYGLVAFWFAFQLMMGSQGRYAAGPQKPPLALGLALVVPISFFIIAYARRSFIWAFCQSLDLRLIVAVHLWRVIAIDFLLCAAEGRLPAGFALPAGLGDIITGLAAIPLALGLSSGAVWVKKGWVAWNIFGLLDLVSAVSLGILYSGSRLGILAGPGHTTQLMVELPRSLIPTFLVPLFILLHLLALARRKEVAAFQRKENENQPSVSSEPMPVVTSH